MIKGFNVQMYKLFDKMKYYSEADKNLCHLQDVLNDDCEVEQHEHVLEMRKRLYEDAEIYASVDGTCSVYDFARILFDKARNEESYSEEAFMQDIDAILYMVSFANPRESY